MKIPKKRNYSKSEMSRGWSVDFQRCQIQRTDLREAFVAVEKQSGFIARRNIRPANKKS